MNKTPKGRLLIVDDEAALMQALCNILQQQGYSATGCISAGEAMQQLRTESFDLLLTDLMMPGTDGLALARSALAHDPQMVAVMMTGEGSIASAVEAMQSGVLDYVLKPFKLGTMLPVLERALAIGRLRADNLRLQQRVLQRTRELEVANDELEAYAASVSHDLRAPLRGIDGLAQLLGERLAQVATRETQDLLAMIGTSSRRAQRLVDDLLRLSRIGRQPLQRVVVDLALLAREVAAELAAGAGRDPASIVVDGHLGTAAVDLPLLRQVFVNLLGNALKYTREVPRACIEVHREDSDGERVYVVSDNGPGFDMSQAGRLFMPFERLQGTQQHEGNGMGLSIVQRIVLRHGGRVWAHAAPGRGASFCFTLGDGGGFD